MYYSITTVSNDDEITKTYVRVENDVAFYWFPAIEGNPEYDAYVKWIAEGNEPEPWNPAEPTA